MEILLTLLVVDIQWFSVNLKKDAMEQNDVLRMHLTMYRLL